MSTPEQVSDGLEHQIEVMADALVALIDQIQPRLCRHADAPIDRIRLFRRGTARQQRRLVPVIDDTGQPGDAGAEAAAD